MSVKLGLITGRTSRVIAQKQHKEPSFTSQAVSLQKDPRHWPIGAGAGGGVPQEGPPKKQEVPQHHLYPRPARLPLYAASEKIYL